MGPPLVERITGTRERLGLVRQHRQPLLAHPLDVGLGARVALDRLGLVGRGHGGDRRLGSLRGS